MKTLVTFWVLLSAIFLSNAQTYFDYYIKSDWYNFSELSDDTLSTAIGDDGTQILSLPFNFEYCDTNYSKIKISTNGWIQFGATFNNIGNNNNLSDPQYKNFVCPLWDDLYADSQTQISYTTEGVYPARYFKIQWKNIRWKNNLLNRVTFQVWLVEFDNSIIFWYGPSSGNNIISGSIGIVNNIGGMNNFISVNIQAPLPNLLELSNTVSYNLSSLSFLTEGSYIEVYKKYKTVKLYQVPDTLLAGGENQVVFSLLHYHHPGGVLTPNWIQNLKFNTYGTTNSSDILRARLYKTGRVPFLHTNYQVGSTIENPGSVFNIGNLNATYFGWLYVSYFWLVFDIAPGAQPGNFIDAACILIESPSCCFPIVPDSSLASGYHVIGVPLPVELVSFSAESNDDNVLLSWTTASENNNKGFEVERSIQNSNLKIKNFETIGFVNGNGTSTELNTYSFNDENVSAGKYIYRLKQIDFDGSYEYSTEIEVEIGVPDEFALYQNYPNPFNPSTTIKFGLPIDSKVVLEIYNIVGQKVTTLINNETVKAGYHQINFNANELATGIYIYKLTANGFTSTKKFVLMK